MTIFLEQYRSGQYEKGYEYRYFVPSKINDEWVWQMSQINTLLERAAVKLGELNSFARLVPNIDLFIRLHVTKEAVVSSRIEGTQTNMYEAVLPERGIVFLFFLTIYRFLVIDRYSKSAMRRQIEQGFDLSRGFQSANSLAD